MHLLLVKACKISEGNMHRYFFSFFSNLYAMAKRFVAASYVIMHSVVQCPFYFKVSHVVLQFLSCGGSICVVIKVFFSSFFNFTEFVMKHWLPKVIVSLMYRGESLRMNCFQSFPKSVHFFLVS